MRLFTDFLIQNQNVVHMQAADEAGTAGDVSERGYAERLMQTRTDFGG